jgi:hypothetical protein
MAARLDQRLRYPVRLISVSVETVAPEGGAAPKSCEMPKTTLGAQQAQCDHGAMRRETVAARLTTWVDCPQCGRLDKLSRDFRLPTDISGPMQLKVRYRCERRGRAAAFLTLTGPSQASTDRGVVVSLR